MKKKIKILFMFGCLSGMLHAQSNIAAAGGDAAGSGGSVSFTVGQIDFISKTGTGGVMTEGVQQPYLIVASVHENELNTTVSIYPNPTAGFVEVEIEDSDVDLNYELLDVAGRVIERNRFFSHSSKVDLSSLSNGIYFLKLSTDDNLQKTFTIIKTKK